MGLFNDNLTGQALYLDGEASLLAYLNFEVLYLLDNKEHLTQKDYQHYIQRLAIAKKEILDFRYLMGNWNCGFVCHFDEEKIDISLERLANAKLIKSDYYERSPLYKLDVLGYNYDNYREATLDAAFKNVNMNDSKYYHLEMDDRNPQHFVRDCFEVLQPRLNYHPRFFFASEFHRLPSHNNNEEMKKPDNMKPYMKVLRTSNETYEEACDRMFGK